MLAEMGGITFDPAQLGIANYAYIDPEIWPESIKEKVHSSITRYMHYLDSEIIKPEEIPRF